MEIREMSGLLFRVLRPPNSGVGCWFVVQRRLVIAGRAQVRHRLASSAAVCEIESNSMLLDLRLGNLRPSVTSWVSNLAIGVTP